MLARCFDGRTDGFYVDVGAGDPTFLSVTKWFYDLGWNGINIEPHPVLHQKLVADRPRDFTLSCGAGAARGDALFFASSAYAELSSFDPRIQLKMKEANREGEERTVAIRPLTEILDQCDVQEIDFMKIDVEGWEREVLLGLDLRKYRPTIMVMESTLPETDIPSHQEWQEILSDACYECVYFDGLNRFYLKEEASAKKRHFSLPPSRFELTNTHAGLVCEEQLKHLRAENTLMREEITKLQQVLSRLQGDSAKT